MPSLDDSTCQTLPHLARERAMRHGERTALKYVGDNGEVQRWSYRDLWHYSADVASRLPTPASDASVMKAPRALLLFPPGLEFMAGFLGAQIAGYIPVPTAYPKPNREMPRLDSAAGDCRPSVLIGDDATLAGLADDRLGDVVRSLQRVSTDERRSEIHSQDTSEPTTCESKAWETLTGDSLAFLQYTSGSTNDPKGVLVRHRNLMSNLESIRRGFQIDWQADDESNPDVGVFWLPFFHDMGLIGGILAPLYVGGTAVLMSPRAFLQRPVRWLQLISQERATISGAPNFAYQLAVDRVDPQQSDELDLSNWKTAFCGAEPIAPRTLSDFANRFAPSGFSDSAFYPCYGLAEATLLAAGGAGPAKPTVITVDRASLGEGNAIVDSTLRGKSSVRLVSCGAAAHQTELLIVDPESCQPVSDRMVGEIWIRGAGVTDGYWNRDEENRRQFQAHLMRAGGDTGVTYCRTGDLGFLHEGDLYITGRLKDVIVLRGRNHYPQDIESTVRETLPSEAGQVAAFAVESSRGESLVVVAELPRRSEESNYPVWVRSIRRSVIEAHEVDPAEIMLVRPATVPLTSSGKVQRRRCREMFIEEQIKTRHHYRRAFAGEQTITLPDLPDSPEGADRSIVVDAIEVWLAEWLTVRAGVHPADVELEKPFAEYGLDSMTAVELSGEIQDWSGVEVTPMVALNYPTVARLSAYVADSWLGVNDEHQNDSKPSTEFTTGDDATDFEPDLTPNVIEALEAAEMEGLLDEIEGLSEDQINHALAEKRRS